MTQLIYDGSFDGFLSCVFTIFEERLKDVTLSRKQNTIHNLFGDQLEIPTNISNSKRVWDGVKKMTNGVFRNTLLYAFYSEKEDVEQLLLKQIKEVFKTKGKCIGNYGDPIFLQLSKYCKSVHREKHRMDAFVRFQLTKDGIYFANIEPDFNVLPLIARHFKERYADQKWLIYDLKRKYGIYYNLETVEEIKLDLINDGFTNAIVTKDTFTIDENNYQDLWNNYFKSTNIKSRKNMRLHIKHVPKRYWKYLSEKRT